MAFFNWLRKQQLPQTPPPRDIILCILIRMLKKKEEWILIILGITNDTYRVMKSRARKRLGIDDDNWETFIKELE